MIPEIDYGPLHKLVGKWAGNKGSDISPLPDGSTETPYHEEIELFASGNLKNAQTQTVSMLRYHRVVRRSSNNEVFHDESGYYIWDAENEIVINAFVLPRGISVLASGNYKEIDGEIEMDLEADCDESCWGILQSPFLEKKAKTSAYSKKIKIGKDYWSYKEKTVLDIYGKSFDHFDSNTLSLV
ncbi:MAG: heme-binding beta-barrel domain-containing protein [Bacteroidota bacterium]